MSAISNSIFLSSEQATENFARELANNAKIGDVFFLYGDVGSGKTTFARAFIKELCEVEGDVISPTFSIMQSYAMKKDYTLIHCDLYRIKSSSELLEIGIYDDTENRITLIEWPEIAEGEFVNIVKVIIAIDGDGRKIIVERT